MARMFIAIKLPRSYQDRVRPLTAALNKGLASSVNWTRPGTWHLTLKFLGETDEDSIPAITDALAAVDLPAFAVEPGTAGTFPHHGQPKVLWLGLKQGARECTALAEAVNDELAALGIAKEKKPFRPHLTLGYVRQNLGDDWQTLLAQAAKEDWPAFTVDRFTLWRKEPHPTDTTHTAVAEFRLN